MDCLFCKIASHEIKADIILETPDIVVFHDIKPQAPSHLLIIPKKHIRTINDTLLEDGPLLGNMILIAKQIALKEGFADNGYRLIFNVNPGGGQEVYHIHLHLLGGRQMTWPPG